jgi:hypothetical protein
VPFGFWWFRACDIGWAAALLDRAEALAGGDGGFFVEAVFTLLRRSSRGVVAFGCDMKRPESARCFSVRRCSSNRRNEDCQ